MWSGIITKCTLLITGALLIAESFLRSLEDSTTNHSSFYSLVRLVDHLLTPLVMSRLNAAIKLLFACGEMLYFLASLAALLVSGIVATGYIPTLTFPLAKNTSLIIAAVSSASLACSCWGCCAVLRQTKRRGCLSGRRMLVSKSLHLQCIHHLVILLKSLTLDTTVLAPSPFDRHSLLCYH